jgi:hypothetical protein
VDFTDIAGLTGLNLASLAEGDVLAPLVTSRQGAGSRETWVELTDVSGVRLTS